MHMDKARVSKVFSYSVTYKSGSVFRSKLQEATVPLFWTSQPPSGMENAELYSMYNSMQRRDIEMVLSEFSHRLDWTENERVLDVGCGPGDVTVELLAPRLPDTAFLVGIDKMKKMIEHANKKYSNSRVEFKIVDFSTKQITEFFPEQSFTKLFSFYCLHWIKDQEQVFKNSLRLLKPGGSFLAIVTPTNNVFLVYKILSEMDKWKPYMQDVDLFIPRFHDSSDVCHDIEELVKNQGLEIITIEKREHTVSFPSMEILMRSNEAVNPFVKRMSQSKREQYMSCIEQIVVERQLVHETIQGEVQIQNSFVIIYARKPHELTK